MNEYAPIILQTIVILIGIIVSVRHSEKRIATMESNIVHLEEAVKPIAGISRKLARLEGRLSQE